MTLGVCVWCSKPKIYQQKQLRLKGYNEFKKAEEKYLLLIYYGQESTIFWNIEWKGEEEKGPQYF
jgi:hypothetical protein